MSYGEVDAIDLVLYPLFLFGGLVGLGLMQSPVLFGFSFADTLMSLGPQTSVSLATLVSALSLVVVLATNKPDLTSARGSAQLWVVIVTFGLILAPPFVPLMSGLLGGGIASGIAFLVQTGGWTVASWLG
jgi:hypothetical protein